MTAVTDATDAPTLIGTDADEIRARRDRLVGVAPELAAADDPVTGPMPAVSFLDGRLRAHTHRDVVVVALDGGLDVELAEVVAPALDGILAGARAAILDLDQVTLLDQEGMDILAAAFAAATDGVDSCLVASRLSGRLVLERWGFTADHAVFTSTADALQARAFAATGYGIGWTAGG